MPPVSKDRWVGFVLRFGTILDILSWTGDCSTAAKCAEGTPRLEEPQRAGGVPESPPRLEEPQRAGGVPESPPRLEEPQRAGGVPESPPRLEEPQRAGGVPESPPRPSEAAAAARPTAKAPLSADSDSDSDSRHKAPTGGTKRPRGGEATDKLNKAPRNVDGGGRRSGRVAAKPLRFTETAAATPPDRATQQATWLAAKPPKDKGKDDLIGCQIDVPTSSWPEFKRSSTEIKTEFYRGTVMNRAIGRKGKESNDSYDVHFFSNEPSPPPQVHGPDPDNTSVMKKINIVDHMNKHPVRTHFTQEGWTAWINNPLNRDRH